MDAYLFDLDGTLIDSRLDIALCANLAREDVGLAPRPLEDLYGFIGEGANRLIERSVGPAHPELIEAALASWRRHYDRHMLDHTRVFDGIFEAVAGCAGPRAVVTNKPGPSARELVEALGLSELFPVVVGAGDVAARKPDPESIRLALSRLGTVERAVMVGDSSVDAATARAAQVPFVGVLWGLGTREEMERAGGSRFVATPGELPAACAEALASWPWAR